MTKIKKTYRLNPEIVMEIAELKEMYGAKGIKLSDSQIIEKAIFDLYTKPIEEEKTSGIRILNPMSGMGAGKSWNSQVNK